MGGGNGWGLDGIRGGAAAVSWRPGVETLDPGFGRYIPSPLVSTSINSSSTVVIRRALQQGFAVEVLVPSAAADRGQ